ncbi:unnamed protein product [Brassica oleracea]
MSTAMASRNFVNVFFMLYFLLCRLTLTGLLNFVCLSYLFASTVTYCFICLSAL